MPRIKMHIPVEQMKRLNLAMKLHVKGLRSEANKVVMKQGRLLAKDLIKFTPPARMSQGKKKVKTEINRAIKPLDFNGISDPVFRKRLKQIEKQRDYTALQAIWKNIPSKQSAKVVPFSPSYHTNVRLRGDILSVPKDLKVYTFDKAEQKAYVKSVQERVGRLKSSWFPLANKLQLPVAQWISRHATYGASVTSVKITVGDKPSIMVWNGAYGQRLLRMAATRALDGRVEAMIAEFKYKVKSKGSNIGRN
jgi:hypothetical protein